LQQYEKQTEIPLAKHPLAEQLQSCDSVDSVIVILQEQARAFGEFRGSDRIMKSLSSVISVLSTLSAAANLGEIVGLVRWDAPIGIPRPDTYSIVIQTYESNSSWSRHPALRM
jgi:hypothetical protein